jgi:hypothetical protein
MGCCLETLTSYVIAESTVAATNGTCYSSSAANAPMSECTGFSDSGYPLI